MRDEERERLLMVVLRLAETQSKLADLVEQLNVPRKPPERERGELITMAKVG